ncbi:MAG: SDR family NAD(P)-dependent oxidoreductase, partial [Geminicoccaceae bacterium]
MSQRVLITAGASGIGSTTALAFAARGDRVHVCDVGRDALAAFAAAHPEIGTSVCDVADEAQVAALFADALARLGGLDFLVNNAGIAGPTAPVEAVDYADWRRCLLVNLDGAFLCARAAAPLL